MDDVEMLTCHYCGIPKPLTHDYFYYKDKKKLKFDKTCCLCRNAKEKAARDTEEARLKRAIRMRRAEARRMGATEGERAMYKIVKDPDKLGGFNPGAIIPSSQVNAGLKLGNFTPHTLLRCKGRFFEVLGGLPEHLRELTRSEMTAKIS